MRAARRRGGPAKLWRHSRLWVKLVALAMVPLLAAGSLSFVLIDGRLRSTERAATIDRLASEAAEAYSLSDHAYFNGYVLAAEIGLGPMTQRSPTLARLVSSDLAQLQSELTDDITTINRSSGPTASLRPAAAQVAALMAQQKASKMPVSVLSADFINAGSSLYGTAQETLARMGGEATDLSGSNRLVQQIQLTTALDATIGDGDAVLVSMFEDIAVTSQSARAVVQGRIQGALPELETNLNGFTQYSPIPLGQPVLRSAATMRSLGATAAAWAATPADRPISLQQVERAGPLINEFAATSLFANATEMSLVGAIASNIHTEAVTATELAAGADALLVLVTLLLTLLTYRGLRRPMHALAIRARQISDGALEFGAEGGSFEIEEVSAALNDAIRNLEKLKAQSEALGTGDLANPVLKEPVPGRLGESLFASVLQATEMQRQLGYRAAHDPLTGLLNREAANESLESALADGRAAGRPVAAAFIDLDGFKQMNDNYGHAFGDQVLRVTADRLAVHAGPDDLVCRIGGDEFLLVVRDASDQAAVDALAVRIQSAVQQPISVGQGEVRLGVSIGIAIGDPNQGYDASQLLREADVAVYKAKSSGRNQVRTFDESTRREGQASVDLAAELRKALDGGSLALHYQPLVGVLGGEVWGFEALLRWEHEGFPMNTEEVITVAESSDLIIDLDRWVLDQACRQLSLWANTIGFDGYRLSVNISGRHVGRNLLADDVLGALEAHDVAPDLLMVEISETTLVGDTEAGRAELSRLRRAGVVVAIDNFGTGHSSIAQLSHFPADLLKIDREFLEPVPGVGEREVIIGLIIGAAHAMEMRVVAAGVEHEEQLVMLRNLGCEIAQGHMIARPMPPSRVSAWTDDWNGATRPTPEVLAAELLAEMSRTDGTSASSS